MTWFLPCRTKHISGSPRHKGLKKTHFIKNMRQYDTRNSRYHVPRQARGRPEAGLPSDPGPPAAALELPTMSPSHLVGARDLPFSLCISLGSCPSPSLVSWVKGHRAGVAVEGGQERRAGFYLGSIGGG